MERVNQTLIQVFHKLGFTELNHKLIIKNKISGHHIFKMILYFKKKYMTFLFFAGKKYEFRINELGDNHLEIMIIYAIEAREYTEIALLLIKQLRFYFIIDKLDP